MNRVAPLPLLGLFAAACAATRAGTAAAPPAAAAPAQGAPLETSGLVAPSAFDALSIWPEAYSGGLLVLEVVPHGTAVADGDVVAKLDTRAIDEELHRAEMEAESAAVRHRGVVERNRLEEESARADLARSRAALDRAQRSLDGWKKDELAFTARQDELQRRYEDANVDDQTDELDQLQKMYDADALVDATEDIVLKRSKRSLELTETQNQLARDRSRYRKELELAIQTEQREEAVRKQGEDLERLTRQQALDAEARADAEKRSADGLAEQRDKLERLRRDRELLVLRAPRAGILLHGAARDYRPGRNPTRHERGEQLPTRQDLFLVADPTPTLAALVLNDTQAAQLPDGTRVRVTATGPAKATASGALHLTRIPSASSPSEASYAADVVLDEGLADVPYGSRVKVAVESGPGAP